LHGGFDAAGNRLLRTSEPGGLRHPKAVPDQAVSVLGPGRSVQHAQLELHPDSERELWCSSRYAAEDPPATRRPSRVASALLTVADFNARVTESVARAGRSRSAV